MYRILIATFVALCVGSAAYGQEYDTLIQEAENRMMAEEYQDALELYEQAFQTADGSLKDLFNAGCAAARSGNPDTAFMYLDQALDNYMLEKAWLEEDEDLVSLHSDARWNDLLAAVDARVEAVMAAFPDKHPEGTVIELPQPWLTGDVSIEETLKNRRSVRFYSDSALTLAEVGQILWAAYGLSKPVEDAPDFLRGGLRTAPSAGALYPLELYLVTRNVRGLDPGVYWYRSETHQLMLIAGQDRWEELSSAGFNQPHFETAAAAIVYSAVFERNTEKYGLRGRERYVCMDLGHSAENVYLQAYALKVGTCAVGAFNDLAIKQTVGMTRPEEPLYIMPLGKLE